MRRFRAVLFMALLACASAFGQDKVLRLAVFLLEPYMMRDSSGAAAGAVVDYWKEYLGPRMGYSIEVLGLYPVKRLEKMLESGEIDVAPLFTKIPSREALFLYPRTHFAEVTSCLAVLPDHPITEVRGQETMYGLKLGFLEAAFVPPLLKHPRITLELVANEDYRQIHLNKLFAGRLDGLLDINQISLMYYLKERNYQDSVRIVPLPVPKEKIYSIFRNTPEGQRLRTEYERVNEEGLRAGVFEAILRRYLGDASPAP